MLMKTGKMRTESILLSITKIQASLLLFLFSIANNISIAGEWTLEELTYASPSLIQEIRSQRQKMQSLGVPIPECSEEDFQSKGVYYLSIDDHTGSVTGHGRRTGRDCEGNSSLYEYKRVTGNVRNGMLEINTGPSVFTYGPWAPVETGDDATTINIKYEDGATNEVRLDDPSGHWQKIKYTLKGKKIEKWTLVYKGYEVVNFNAETISEKRLEGDIADQLVGGLRVNWLISVDFRVQKSKGRKTYLDGSGSARVTGAEIFSRPPGVYDCHADENPIPVTKMAFRVDGSISGDTVKLTLPENDFQVTVDCLLDKDALKEYIRAQTGATSFPSLEKIPANPRGRFTGSIVNPGDKTRAMPLQDHSKIISSSPLEGLQYTLSRNK
jgi:hypothetical protein